MKSDLQLEVVKKVKAQMMKYVVGAFCGDTDDQFYHFNKKDKSEGITLNHDVYVALVKYKSVFEKQNYYEWIKYLEKANLEEKRISDYYGVTLEREGNSPGWWRIIADGDKVKQTFYWTLKPVFVEALEQLEILKRNPKYWLLPANDDSYDIEKAYLEYHTIDWHQTNNNVAVNDIIYIYKSLPHQIIRFTCRVMAINKKTCNKKVLDYYKDSAPYENKDKYMTLKFVNRFENEFPDMEGLKKNGISLVRKLMNISDQALAYIKDIEKSDNTSKRFDGTIPSDIPTNHWSLVGGDEEELKEKVENEVKQLSDTELFEKARQQGVAKPKAKKSTTATYARNAYVAEASKRRVKGICQLCGQPAPFQDKNGNPYLESHHIV